MYVKSPKDGFVIIERKWNTGDVVTVDVDMSIHIWIANPHVRADLNKVAIQRGPIVYCAEGVDNGSDLHLIHLTKDTKFQYQFTADQFGGVGIIKANAEKINIELEWEDVLYCEDVPKTFSSVNITLIPYYCWANRGENEMLVWLNKK